MKTIRRPRKSISHKNRFCWRRAINGAHGNIHHIFYLTTILATSPMMCLWTTLFDRRRRTVHLWRSNVGPPFIFNRCMLCLYCRKRPSVYFLGSLRSLEQVNATTSFANGQVLSIYDLFSPWSWGSLIFRLLFDAFGARSSSLQVRARTTLLCFLSKSYRSISLVCQLLSLTVGRHRCAWFAIPDYHVDYCSQKCCFFVGFDEDRQNLPTSRNLIGLELGSTKVKKLVKSNQTNCQTSKSKKVRQYGWCVSVRLLRNSKSFCRLELNKNS